MTVVGKILVFLNLVFSLVVGAFAVMDYTARTHWADYAGKMKSNNDALRAMTEAYKKQADLLAKDKADMQDNLNRLRVQYAPAAQGDKEARSDTILATELKVRTDEIKNLRDTIDTLRKQLTDEKDWKSKYLALADQSTKDMERRQEDAKVMRQQLKDELGKNFNLIKDRNDMRDSMVQARIAERTLKDRNTQLEDALRKAHSDLAVAKTLGARGPGGSGINPPAENVEGLVRRAEGNLVTISLGSDAGLARGQTMEVFRLGQNARYVGRIRIVEVTPTQAVGQATGRVSTPIQVGDRVASRIVGGY